MHLRSSRTWVLKHRVLTRGRGMRGWQEAWSGQWIHGPWTLQWWLIPCCEEWVRKNWVCQSEPDFQPPAKNYRVHPGSETLRTLCTSLETCNGQERVEFLYRPVIIQPIVMRTLLVTGFNHQQGMRSSWFFSGWVQSHHGWFFLVIESLLSLYTWISQHFWKDRDLSSESWLPWHSPDHLKRILLILLISKDLWHSVRAVSRVSSVWPTYLSLSIKGCLHGAHTLQWNSPLKWEQSFHNGILPSV